MPKWKVTARVRVEETAKIDFMIEAKSEEEAYEKVSCWEGEELDEYEHIYLDRALFMENEWTAEELEDE